MKICECAKPNNWLKEERNVSEHRTTSLISKRMFYSALNEPKKNQSAKFNSIQCDLCNTVFKTALYFHVHKSFLGHKRRYMEFLKFIEIVVNLKQSEAWSKITKPPKITAKNVLKALGALRKN